MASPQTTTTTSSFPATVNVDDVVSDPESLIRLLRAYDPAFDGAQAVRAAYEDAFRHRQGQGRGQNHGDMMDMDMHDSEDHDHQSQATTFGRLTGNALVDWVTAHVNSDTLLSVDEMNQYAALERVPGLLPHLEATLSQPSMPPMSDLKPPSDPSKVPPLSDQEIRAATQELIRSTSLITRQTEALREQQDHLDRLVAEHKRHVQARAALEVQQLKGLGERQRELVQSVVELALFLADKVDELEAQNEDRKADVETLVDGMFHSDDHVLSSLQKLGDQLSMSRSCSSGEEEANNKAEEEDMVRSLRDVCARMIKFHVEGIRTRLDRIYLETLHAAIESGAGTEGDGSTVVTVEDVASVQRELEELYTEILPVGQMAIEHQFLRPALDDLAAKNGRSLEQSTQAAHYIDECLDYLLDRITTIRACLQEYLSHQQAVAEFAQLTRPELNTNGLVPKDPTDSSQPGAPQAHHRRHSSFPRQIPADSLSPSLKSILQTLGIPIPSADPSTQSHLSALQSSLDSTLVDRQQKRDDLVSAAQSSFEDAVTRHIGDAKAALAMLRDSVLAESPWGAVRLVDEELEGGVDVLRQELGEVEGWRVGVEAGVKASSDDERREQFLRKWGEGGMGRL
ncbi:hypothetical protein QBC32DRAFT_360666 [Pseudoneurospora amorphoporcata]|uniref:Uncharacterized protein n=1 Tax=Pseudoneurospora amorphoporcata TaxID=241081 RepID=A0AAN6SGW6_9PEZI|nr:hypothetical protein QBC32DRAFT_360666 [Pseudoneurospora amorphoporcata]